MLTLSQELNERFTPEELTRAIDYALLCLQLECRREPLSLEDATMHYEVLYELKEILTQQTTSIWK